MSDRMPDSNTAALHAYEAEQARGQALMEAAEVSRAGLVEDWLHEADAASVSELIAELMAGNPKVLDLVRRMLAATTTARSLERDHNRAALMNAGSVLCHLIRAEADRIHGDELVEREADRIEHEKPCRCRVDCYC